MLFILLKMQKGVNWCYNKPAKRCKLLYKQGDIMRRKYLNDLIEWMNDPRRKLQLNLFQVQKLDKHVGK